MTALQKALERDMACSSARDWVGDKTLKQAYEDLDNESWMTWILEHYFSVVCTCDGYSDEGCIFSLEVDEMKQKFPVESLYEKMRLRFNSKTGLDEEV